MFEWLKRIGAPKVGPDYRHVDSREKAEQLCKSGELKKLLLLPAEFGGDDIPVNVVYVPKFAAEIKERIDENTIMPLAQEGKVRRYAAIPEYEGKSVVPSQIRISATEPGSFEAVVAVWGLAVQREAKKKSRGVERSLIEFSLNPELAHDLSAEDFVRSYIDDYQRWNNYADQLSDEEGAMAAIEAAYSRLSRKYCLPDQKHQPIAYGSESSHDNAREAVVGVEQGMNTCVVSTRHTKAMGKSSFTSDYEYHLKKVGERWFLTSLVYVDEEGKWEGL